jgi:hypothetical protein
MRGKETIRSGGEWKQLLERCFEVDSAELPVRIPEARRSMLNRAKEIFDRTEDQEFCELCNGLRNLRLLEDRISKEPRAAA